jgi:hypothetical protein
VRRRWEYGVALIDPKSGGPGLIIPTDEADARALTEENYPWAVLYRRPQPKPWQLVPTQQRDQS